MGPALRGHLFLGVRRPSCGRILLGPLRRHRWPSALWRALFRYVLPVLLGCELPGAGHLSLNHPNPHCNLHMVGGGQEVTGSGIPSGRYVYPHLCGAPWGLSAEGPQLRPYLKLKSKYCPARPLQTGGLFGKLFLLKILHNRGRDHSDNLEEISLMCREVAL